MDADVIVVGAGLAGLVAAHELTAAGKKVALVDQENTANLGGQAYWSFGGLFLVDSPEQRRMRVRDSVELAWSDWQGSAQFDRIQDEDAWAVKWARAYTEFAAGEKRSWLTGHGLTFLPNVGWAERGDLRADGHGNSVPRFHIAWGTGTGVVELSAQAVIVTTGGIGASHDLVRQYWPARLGAPPDVALHRGRAELGSGVARPRHPHPARAIRHVVDALGRRLPGSCLPGYDTIGTLRHLRTTGDIAGYGHSWFILNQRIIGKEFALSGSEQNPDITSKDRKAFVRERLLSSGATPPVAAFLKQGADFVVAATLDELVKRMNDLTGEPLLDAGRIRTQIEARDRQVDNPFSKDRQVQGIRNSRRYLGDRVGRTAAPHRILDPAAGPLIAVMLHILTRKTLGGIQTDLSSRALGADGQPVAGLYAAGEVAGFGGGGMHGYNALEGTFLGGCVFSGRIAGRHAAAQVS